MKSHRILAFLIPSLLLSGCSQPLDSSSDGYIDKLPNQTADGAILHCFNWSYKNILDNLQSIADSGYKSIQIMPVQQPKNGGAQWWAYYQPLSLSIAEESFLGTKEELKTVCDEAEKLGISVIADIVFNHLANEGEGLYEDDETPVVSHDVENYEKEIYDLRNDKENPTFHHIKPKTGPGSVTQYYPYGDLPDLNTGHPLVQARALKLLKDCIDLGIDGFRFDAAKHIETPTDSEYASDFWPNTLGVAKQYYKSLTNKNLFSYGEILMDAGGGRGLDAYTKYMGITDDGYFASKIPLFVSSDIQRIVDGGYGKKTDPSNLVTWIESHDKYIDGGAHFPLKRMRQFWACIASRKDSRGLFFARPNEGNEVGLVADYMFEDPIIGELNRFHNRFASANEHQFAEGGAFVNERFDNNQAGFIVSNSKSNDTQFTTDKLINIPNRVYYDQISGNPVEVRDGHASFTLDKSGVAVVTSTKNEFRPIISLSNRGGSFAKETTIKITVKNATKASYTLNDDQPIEFSDSTEISIGGNGDSRTIVKLKVDASNSQFSTSKNAVYKKIDLIPGGFNVSNFNLDNFNNYEVYLWKWKDGSDGFSKWSKDYTMQGTTMLVDVEGLTGFLIGLFPKGHVISNVNKWDEACEKQTSDIKGDALEAGFFDATGF